MAVVFRSRSANQRYVEQKRKLKEVSSSKAQIVRYIERKEQPMVTYWIGKVPEDFISYGRKLGYVCRSYEAGEPSVLIHSHALIVKEADQNFHHRLATLSFASSYGIPLVWVNRYMHPGRWIWYFDICLVGDIKPAYFWRRVCQELL